LLAKQKLYQLSYNPHKPQKVFFIDI